MRTLERAAQAAAFGVLLLALYSAILQQPLFFAVIRSGSMAPLLQTGDLAVTLPTALHRPRPGDIALFQPRAGLWVVHRIVGGDAETGFYTRGDANPETDQRGAAFPLVTPSSIVATVPAPGGRPLKLPMAGLVSFYLQDYGSGANPLPALLLLGALLMLLWPASGGTVAEPRRRVALLPLLSVAIAGLLALFMVDQGSTISPSGDLGTGLSRAGGYRGGVSSDPVFPATISLENDSPVPLLLSLSARSPGFPVSPDWLLLWPGERAEAAAFPPEGGGGEPGGVEVRALAFLPVLPPPLLHRLAGRSPWLTVALCALIPVLPLLLLDGLAARRGCRPALPWTRGR